jgi:hypothetical protein
MLDPHGAIEFLLNLIDARLRDVGPNAQDIREVLDFDHIHSGALRSNFSANFALPLTAFCQARQIRPSSIDLCQSG